MAELREAVVIDVVRSAIGKSGRKGMEKRGQLCEASAQELMAAVMRGLIDRTKEKSSKFDESYIEDVILGCLSQIGEQALNIGRIATLLANIPKEAAGCTVNRYCNAGLQAINFAAMSIMTGMGDVMIGGGVEIMSHYGIGSDLQVAMKAGYPIRMTSRMNEIGMSIPQGVSAELIAEKYGLTREELDTLGLRSNQKATKAQREGLYDDHIIPYEYDFEGSPRRVDTDEVIRTKCEDDPEAAFEDMKKLKSPFKENGVVTAGNSSQIVDGAAAALLMSADMADKLGLEPLVKIKSMAVAGDDPTIMLLAPIPAMKKALERAGEKMERMEVIEPNEAFASPVLAYMKEFGIEQDDPRVNPTGGAIALGHPIGASGVIYFGEMVHHMRRNGLKKGIQALCGGGGVGIATVVEAV